MSHSFGPHTHRAFFDFREETKDLEGMSADAQVGVLKHKLYVALERAVDFQSRSRDLESQLERLHAETRDRAREHQAFAARSNEELVCARLLCQCLLQTIEAAVALDPSLDLPAPPKRLASA
jgi:hypothetical protein